ncbi:hypothetical protein OJ252_3219 [Cryptosporidium canis]|uniref:C2H2-type domain-containing protein n=1 Tax=Cryptosporidium canis TaxID=195482 RepID=A0ABQ8P306_9CRYT|nr:hypothetical protein OJ252_3219 [Cryptosporidium canis]
MGLGQRKSRKAGRSKNRAVGKYVKTKRRTKDFETVQNDYIKGVELPVDMDLPGHGQFYCITCGRYFINSASLMSHNKSKDHKRIGTAATAVLRISRTANSPTQAKEGANRRSLD